MSEEEGSGVVEEEYDETGTRNIWAILTWTVVGITIILNLSLIFILVTRRNLKSIANKLIFTVAISDLIYGCMVSPFFVENYVRLNWEQSLTYCRFYTFYFTFHDVFAPLCLIALSIYVSLKFTGVTAELKWKKNDLHCSLHWSASLLPTPRHPCHGASGSVS